MLYITYLGFFLYGRHTSSLCWLIQLLVSVWTPGYLYLILCLITQNYIIYFVAQIVCILHCLIPGTTTPARLSPPLESPLESAAFSQELWLLRRMMLGNPDLDVLVATGVSSLGPFQLTEHRTRLLTVSTTSQLGHHLPSSLSLKLFHTFVLQFQVFSQLLLFHLGMP